MASNQREREGSVEQETGQITRSGASGTSNETSDRSGLPRLEYDLWEHRKKLFLISSLLVLELSLLPLGLYYGLWYGTTLRHGILFAIITSFFGIITGLEFALRSWRLLQPGDTFRPIGGHRWACDFTHWTLSVVYTIMTAILIGASIPYEPLVKPLSIPVSLFLIQVGAMLLITGLMNAFGKTAPFRVSSIAKGERMHPLIYTFVEDVVAVDGRAGKAYRERFQARYKASPQFRKLIADMNWFWGGGAFVVGVATLVVIWTVSQEISFGVGWGAPLLFVSFWASATVRWVNKALRIEKQTWLEGAEKPVGAC